MEIKEIIALIEAVSTNELTDFTLEQGEMKLSMKREENNTYQYITNTVEAGVQAFPASQTFSADQPFPAGQTPATAQTFPATQVLPNVAEFSADAATNVQGGANTDTSATLDANDKLVTSPLIGTFYSAPSPDAEPFVKVGDHVTKGQTIGIVEAMKLMNEIECEYDGVVESILVENEGMVEYGQPLIRVR